MTATEFEQRLRVALRNEVPGTASGGVLFQKLSTRLWNAAKQYDPARQANQIEHDNARSHVAVALEIQGRAEEVVRLLESRQLRIREALTEGYLLHSADAVQEGNEFEVWPTERQAVQI